MRSDVINWEKIIGFCEKVCYFFIINLLCLLSNIPVLLFFLFVGISQVRDYLPLFLLSMVPLPPALSAVFYSMHRLMKGTETSPFKDYLRGYQMDFLQKLGLSFGHLLLLFILWTNVEFFAKQIVVLPLTILFFILFVFVILITPNLYLLASRYQMDNRALIKAACILTVTRPILTLGNVAALGIVLMSIELMAGTAVLFMASVYGFFVVFISKSMLLTLEENR